MRLGGKEVKICCLEFLTFPENSLVRWLFHAVSVSMEDHAKLIS